MTLWKKLIITAILVTIIIIAGTVIYYGYFAKRRLIISTTTSLYDTGLLDLIEKDYELKHNDIDIQIIAAGTGIAIQHAKSGDADLILVHSPSMEKTFLEEGYGVNRKIFAYNFFTIVGPQSNPAGISGKNATEALKSIVAYGDVHPEAILWVSRWDNSGTHSKEQALWKAAGYNYTVISNKPWYAKAGSGMGDTLQLTDQKSAYTLSDVGTYLKFYKDGIISLKALITEDTSLLNVYSAIAVKPSVPANKTIHEQINFKDAMDFIQYLVSPETQQLITNYGKDAYGQSLFFGAVESLKNNEQPIAGWIRDYAYISGYECPPQYRSGYEELYTYW